MKLLSTLDFPLGTADYDGHLRTFFCTLNPGDYTMNGQALFWNGDSVNETYNLPTGDVITVQLQMVGSQQASQLFVQGHVQVTTSGGVTFGGGVPMVSNGGLFVKDTPNAQPIVLTAGIPNGQQGSLRFNIGFELTVPWDGTSATCTGKWHAKWH